MTAEEEKERERIFTAALRLLAARSRSEEQLRERLLRLPGAGPALVDQCIVRLKELRYVDDGQFAHGYVNSRLRQKAVGRARLARELAGRKVSPDAVERALDSAFAEVSEEELIVRAIEKRLRTHGRPADPAALKRLADHLARLGFSYDLIIRRLRFLRSNDSILDG